ncbi:MAG: type IV pilus assembly protein PilM [Planctomycetota bacterium]
MSAFQTVWSIDVGKSSLKAVKMHRERNSLEILAVDKVDYPIETSGVNALQGPKDALKAFAERNSINCPVIVSHPGHSAFSRFIRLPPVDPKKLQEMVGYEAQQQIPFPIDEVVWDFHVSKSEEAGTEREVGIFAVRKEVISDFILDYESNNIKPDHVSVGYIGLLNYVRYDLTPNKPCVVIDIGSDHTDLLVVDGHRFWVRNLGIAGNDVTQALQEKLKLPFDEAEKLKRNAGASKEQMAKIFPIVQPILKELVNEIHRSVGFYKSQAGDVKFEDVFLFGNGSRLIGIKNYLQEHLRFNVHQESRFHRIRVNRDVNVALLQKDFPAFSAVVGHAVMALGDGECNVNLLPSERKEEISFHHKQKLVIVAALGLFIAPLFLHFNFKQKIENVQDALTNAGDVKSLEQNNKQMRRLEQERRPLFEKRQATLLAYGANRLQPPVGARALEDVFRGLKSDSTTSVALVEGEPELAAKLSALESDMLRLNIEKSWICWLSVEAVNINPAGKKLEKAEKVDAATRAAYEFQVCGMIDDRGQAKDNEEFVRKNVVLPLQEHLSRDLGREVKVDVVQGTGAKPIRLHQKHPFASKDSIAPGEQRAQGSFYEYRLTWHQTAVAPPVAESAVKQ